MRTNNSPNNKLKKAAKIFLNLSSQTLDYAELDDLLGDIANCPNNKEIKSIVARMIEINKSCVDYEELSGRLSSDCSLALRFENPYLSASSFHPGIQKSIRDRMTKLNKSCTDYDELKERLENEDDYVLIQIIEAQMTKLNNYCNDYHKLYSRWKEGLLRKEIKKRMFKLNKIQLPEIVDCDELVRRSWCFVYIPAFQQQFEARFLELMREESFSIELMNKGQRNLPDFLTKKITTIAQKILQEK